ncbi:Ig domain-containing protein [Nocardioides baekrokdamisoli]|nr:Ig domain-containing protein [Nocardioides baekrokdamisoli]
MAGLAGIAALATGAVMVPVAPVAAATHGHGSSQGSGAIPPEEGTYHHSHSTVRHYTTKNPAAPQAGAVGTTAGKTLSWQGGSNINGQAAQGVTSSTPKVYLVYWGNQWGTQGTNAAGNVTMSNDYAGGAPVAEALFKGLGTGGEKWSGVLTQYCDGTSVAVGATSCPAAAPHVGYPTGGALAGVWYDNSAAEPVPASGDQLSNEALAAAAHFGNTTAASNRYAQYIILSAPGTDPDSYKAGNSGCAWHTAAWSSTMQTQVAFTNQPYNMDTNFCGKNFLTAGSGGTLDGYTMTMGHEYAETVTDQYPSSGWVNTQATDGGENGDDCAWSGSSAYVQMSTGSFAMQPTWSNDTNACDISHVIVGGQQANTVTVTNPGSQTGTVGTAKSLQIAANDSGGAAMTYAATGLPAGLSINANTGLISGTPTTSGTSNVTVTATDTTGVSGSTSFAFTVNPVAPQGNTVTVTNPGNQTATVGTGKSVQIHATDSSSSATLTYSATGLPAGLSINANTGLISGTPSAAGTSSTTVKATDNTGVSSSATFSWSVSPKAANTVAVTNPGNQTGTVGTAANLQMHGTDSASAALTYSAIGLPAGLSINASTGLISGTPTAAATTTVTVKATDSTGASGSAPFTWTVNPKPSGSCTSAQLFANPGFESGSANWAATFGVINSDNWMSRSGNGYAWLDGYSSAGTDTLSQKVTIPAGCKATLSYWAYIYTDQTSASAIDTMSVTVNGTKVQTLSNANASNDYVQHTIDLSAYAGQTVTVQWTGVQVGSTSTSFLIDDTALNVAPSAASTVARPANVSGSFASWFGSVFGI